MNGFENSMNCGLGIFIENREVHLDSQCSVGSALASYRERLVFPTLGTVLR